MAQYDELFNLFKAASRNLRYPSIKLQHKKFSIKLYRAAKGYVGIKISGEYIGKIASADADLIIYPAEYKHLESFIQKFALSPIENAVVQGKKYRRCCFCGRELDNASSVFHGYGPICAEKWELPWGELPKKITESEMNMMDFYL